MVREVEGRRKLRSKMSLSNLMEFEKEVINHSEVLINTPIGVGQPMIKDYTLHCIISDKESIDWMEQIYNKHKNYLAYMVILPYMNVGFGAKHPKKVDWNHFDKFLNSNHKSGQIAIGANGWNFLVKNSKKYNIPIFDPELFSKYICLDDNLSTYNNSFDMKPVPFIPGEGFELGHARTEFPSCD